MQRALRLRPGQAGILCLLAIALPMRAAAQTEGGVDPPMVQAFVGRLQRAIAGNDKRAVASLAAYPTRVMVSGLDVPILNPSELVRLFDIVFTPDMRCAIGQARLDVAGRPQARVPVSVAADGVSIGAGMIWAQMTAGALKIHRVIVRQSTVVQPSRPPPRRIEFPDPALPLREAFSGRLGHDRVDSYVLSAKRGQVLEATIGGFRGKDAALRVLDHRTSAPVAAAPQAAVRTWTAALPVTGQYRIEVARTAPYCDPSFTYSLIVTLR